MPRKRRFSFAGFALALGALLLTSSAALAFTWARSVSGGTNHSGTQYWTFAGYVPYSGYQNSGGYYNYEWDTETPTTMTLSADTGYSNATVYYRAVIYQPNNSSTVLWDSSAPNQMDGDTINGNSGDTKGWYPSPSFMMLDSGPAFICETATDDDGTGATYTNWQCLGYSDIPSSDCNGYP